MNPILVLPHIREYPGLLKKSFSCYHSLDNDKGCVLAIPPSECPHCTAPQDVSPTSTKYCPDLVTGDPSLDFWYLVLKIKIPKETP